MQDDNDPEKKRERALRAANEKVNDAMRVMFARWGEARIARAEEMARAKEAVEEAEVAFEQAREELQTLLQAPPGSIPEHLDMRALRRAVERLATALERGETDPDAVFHGELPDLGHAAWQQEVASPDLDVWVLADDRGSVVAKITHSADAPRWTTAVLNESTGELE